MASPIRKKEDRLNVEILSELIQQEKDLKKKIEEIKTQLKAKYTSGTHKCGDFEVIIDESKRESVTKKSIIEKFGQDVFDELKTVSEYKTIKIKKIG